MVKKLMFVISLLAFSATLVSTAEAMETPDKENQDRSPGAPQKKRRIVHQRGNPNTVREIDFESDEETEGQ